MLVNRLKTALVATAVGGAMLIAVPAGAAPIFEVSPGAVCGACGGEAVPFLAANINGVSSALISNLTGTGGLGSTQREQGIIKFQNFTDNSSNTPFGGGQNGLLGAGGHYGLVLVFDAHSVTTVGVVGSANNQNQLTALTYTIYADVGNNDTVNVATIGGTAPTFSNTGDDLVIGDGILISGVASFNSNGGPAFNAFASFNLCNGAGTASQGINGTVADANCTSNIGINYFTQPVPFFNIAFAESNTNVTNLATGPGFPNAGSFAAIVQDTAALNFAASVPEPSTLSLFGMGFLGLGAMFRRRRQKVAEAA